MQSLASTRTQSWLNWFLKGILFLGITVIVGRLAELQIIKGEYFRSLSEGNRIRRVSIAAPRGEILARGGEVLVGNEEIKRRLVFNPQSGFEKLQVEENTKADEVITEWARRYVLGPDLAHVSGYLGQVGEDEVNKIDAECPEKGTRKSQTWEGRNGLEEEYGCTLRGIDGEELVEVDTFGKKIRTLGTKDPQSGTSIKTTIDYSLQKRVAEVVKRAKDLPASRAVGVIATDGFGEVLAFYSSPSFDPNVFLQKKGDDSNTVRGYLIDSSLPLFNRIVSGAYHPGSIFKLVTAVGALEEEKIDEGYLYDDQGVVSVNKFNYANWYFTQYGGREGRINIERALARSTDTFFYKVGEFLGAEKLSEWALKFGIGKITGVDLPGEVAGLVPTPEWKKRVKGENWFLGNTYHMAIGQGDLTTTPLEANLMTSVVANGGSLCKPHIKAQDRSECEKLGIKEQTLEIVKKGMIAACSVGGTGYPFFEFTPKVACKTGTAETDEKDTTHAWFTAFGPVEKPEIVITVLVEKGGEGSKVAAPIAKDILDYWFHERKN